MEKVIVIVTKNGTKYTIGTEKTVEDVLLEIDFYEAGRNRFICINDNCAIRIDEISSVEQFEISIPSDDNEIVKVTTGTKNTTVKRVGDSK